ncbi:MAG: 3-isopropylmalate dehydrogenase [Anaerolineae bacterium]|nr:3-isopropylmalate dehydrogenase [Anaerolineae bacterium]
MKATIAVLAGDGIGPEVVAEGIKVLQSVATRYGHSFAFPQALVGGCAIDVTGKPLPTETFSLCQASDAVLFGAVGGPKWDDPSAKVRPEQGLLEIRKGLGLFANLRPVRVYPQLVEASTLRPEVLRGVDILVVRELTGGLYFGERQEGTERAYDTMVYTRPEIERVVRVAARAAQGRRKKLASVDKANILASSRLWRRVTTELLSREFSDLQVEHVLVDACAMYLIRRPATFDVIVTENMFGDILTDEAAMLAGSMGMLPSASLGEGRRGLYEPIHGTAPDIAGKHIANPLATILSCAMLLRHSLGLEVEAKAVEDAVAAILAEGKRTVDIATKGESPISTVQMGDAVARQVAG